MGYVGGKDFSRGTNFTCMATSGDGFVAVGSKVGVASSESGAREEDVEEVGTRSKARRVLRSAWRSGSCAAHAHTAVPHAQHRAWTTRLCKSAPLE